MTREQIQAFSQAQAEPIWLQDLRLKAFDKIQELDLPKIERVNGFGTTVSRIGGPGGSVYRPSDSLRGNSPAGGRVFYVCPSLR